MIRPAAQLAELLPGVLDALGFAGTGLLVIADRGDALERWYTNEPAAVMLGYTVAELDAVPPIDVIVPEQRAMVSEMSTRFRGGLPVPPTLELFALRKDGSRIPLELAMGYHPLPDGVVYVMVIRDLAAHQPTQLSLLEADRIGLVGALSAGFAHEINNPLTSVLLNLRSLRKQLAAHLPATVQAVALRCLDDVTTGAERIASNVRALQTLATRSGVQRLDLAAIASAALRLAAPTLEPRAQVIRQLFPVPPVEGEESRVGQAVLAMLLFASSGFESTSSHARSQITVAVEERAGAVVVEVSDNGPDLTPEEARRAFDPFFQSKTRGAAVGLGLGVARSVATTLGGDVTLAPRPGGGAVITMRVPIGARDA